MVYGISAWIKVTRKSSGASKAILSLKLSWRTLRRESFMDIPFLRPTPIATSCSSVTGSL